MSDSRIIMEISFNIIYLVFIWGLVILMGLKYQNVKSNKQHVALRFLIGFFLLALGDTGHVGFRVVAFLSGGLEQNALLVGLGALSTAITITFLYMILVDIWRLHFKKETDLLYFGLMAMGLVRLIIMMFPQNQWGNVVPPFDWSLYRNIPLIIIGIGVAILILHDSLKEKDIPFRNVSVCILVSYAFYLPVILLVQQIPLIGMLMIPKTVAYMVMAWLAYFYYFK